MPAPTLPVRQLFGVALTGVVVAAIELTARPAVLDPAVLLPVLVVAATVVGGLTAGSLTGVVGALYMALYYSQPESAVAVGGAVRVVGSVVASAIAGWSVVLLRDRIDLARATAAREAEHNAGLIAFAAGVANEPSESMPDAVVVGVAELLGIDQCVLTVLDPPSGRHFVRSVYGTGASAIGVEVVPGVGITGRALLERRMVGAAGHVEDSDSVSRWKRRLDGRPTGSAAPSSVAAVPAMQGGRAIATLTVGRSNADRPFDAGDVALLEAITPIVTLAVSATLARRELEEGSPRDPQTGLYNRAYLEAALEQLLALRKRAPPEARPPLSMIMFDVDSFRLLNERHGRPVGDHVLRAIATLLRQRFRASDVMARVGPDSFFVVLNGADAEVSAEAAAHIRRQVRELSLSSARGEPVVVSVSAGCAVFRDGEKAEAILHAVEAALETARLSGPGAVVSI